jgi:cytoskeleton protein RodZ
MNDLSQVSTLVEGSDATESVMVLQNLSVGERLAASRQQKSWSIQYVADQLKLSQGQILALESDKFELLPKLVIVRGFVRAYAKLLKIDADNLIASLPKDITPTQLETSLRPALSTPFVDSRLSLLGHHDNNRRYIVGAIFLVLLVAIFLIVQRTDFGKKLITMFQSPVGEQLASDVSVEPGAMVVEAGNASATVSAKGTDMQKMESAPVSMPALQGVEVVASPTISSEDKSLTSSEPQEKLSAPVPTAKNVAPIDAATSNNAANAVATAAVAADSNVIVLKFRENSWIQVKTETGTVLSSHLAKAGTEESFSVKQSLLIRIGNVAGVDAILRGQALTISSERGSNVANLVVK